MSYKCTNIECEGYNKECNPGGKLTVKNGAVHFTGSKCKWCGEEMLHLMNGVPVIHNIKNDSDGRNL